MEQPPRKVGFFPVVDAERLVGLVTLHSLVSAGL
jgi:CBS domain-containing protein